LDMDDFDPSRGVTCGRDGEVGGGECKVFPFVFCWEDGIYQPYADIFRIGV
jgi:hypothetical protein